MKLLLVLLLGWGLVRCCPADTDSDYQNAIRFGAKASYVYRVVDDAGKPVVGAIVLVWFRSFGREWDNANWKAATDVNGEIVVTHRVNEWFGISVGKEGYYWSHDRIAYLEISNPAVRDGMWQPYGEHRTLVLKRMLQPHRMEGPVRPRQRKIATFDTWLKLDLEKGDFLPPLGSGACADALVRFRKDQRSPQDWMIAMDLSFTNHAFAGAYRLKKDSWSEMKSVYHADTNAVFQPQMTFYYKRDGGAKVIDRMLGGEEYLVFRTRTQTDSEGRLLSARYGKLYGPWHFADAGGSRITSVLMNTEDNDTNLEDLQTVEMAMMLKRE